MISFPNAKINLGLDIVERRKDGFHNLSSCFYPVRLQDILEINISDRFKIELSGLPLPGDKNDNLVVRAYKLLKKDFDLPNIAIHLHKNIPAEAGLGGGSSDATFTLQMLNERFDLFLNETVLEEYAGMLGSDCPFFIYNKPMIVGGRGEDMNEINLDLKGYHIYLVKPPISIFTKEAYKNIQPQKPSRDISSILSDDRPASWAGHLKNDFEKVIFHKHPELSEIKSQLYKQGAVYASMTGSGSAIYGIFDDVPALRNSFPNQYFTWVGVL